MGLFDSPDERLRKNLRPDAREIAEAICAETHRMSIDLSHHHTRELEYVLFIAWLQSQIDEHGLDLIGEATPMQLATAIDQATRIGRHFTPAQGAAYDDLVRHIKQHPAEFAVTVPSGRRAPQL